MTPSLLRKRYSSEWVVGLLHERPLMKLNVSPEEVPLGMGGTLPSLRVRLDCRLTNFAYVYFAASTLLPRLLWWAAMSALTGEHIPLLHNVYEILVVLLKITHVHRVTGFGWTPENHPRSRHFNPNTALRAPRIWQSPEEYWKLVSSGRGHACVTPRRLLKQFPRGSDNVFQGISGCSENKRKQEKTKRKQRENKKKTRKKQK